MASQVGGGGAGAGGRPQSQIQSLAGQGSLYNLTLNEVQSHLSEPLLSMNLDELLKSIFPDETNQSQTQSIDPVTPGLGSGPGSGPGSSGLQRQGSVSMPRALSKKTVDEVWRGIAAQEESNINADDLLGEMTLEAFLVKAGVVVEGYGGKGVNNSNLMGGVTLAQPQPVQWFNPGPAGASGGYMAGLTAIGPGTVIDTIYADGGGQLSDPQTPGRKRGLDSGEMVDKMMERRQKRMIKNRESAARSRARKQAYTNELENKVSRLEEENERLKKQKVIDKILCAGPPPAPQYQLRRTSSASF